MILSENAKKRERGIGKEIGIEEPTRFLFFF